MNRTIRDAARVRRIFIFNNKYRKDDLPSGKSEVTRTKLAAFFDAFGVAFDGILKLLTPILTLLTVLVGIYQFHKEQVINETQEFKRQLWTRRLDAYTQTSELVSSIIASANRGQNKKLDSLTLKFEEVYMSKLPLFDDKTLNGKMENFHTELDNFRYGEGNTELLHFKGYALIETCMKSLNKSLKEIESASEKNNFIKEFKQLFI